jgi:polar amino acid transport system permease protein
VRGAEITIVVAVLSILLALILAVLGALGRLSSNPVINGAASLYVSLIRGTPLLVQIYFWYLGLAQLGLRTGLTFLVLPPIVAGIGALGVNYGAYMTEIFRAGIQAVPRGQAEAARALGMPERLVFRRIVLPQAFRIVIPAIGNEFIAMIKDTSLVSVIAIQELLWRAQTTSVRFIATFEGLLIASLVYWVLTIVFSFFQERLERRLAESDR